MQSKFIFILKWPLFMVIIVGIASSLISIYFLTLVPRDNDSYKNIALETGSQAQQNLYKSKLIKSSQKFAFKEADSGLPIRLRIPKINVDAAFEYVGLTPDGEMDLPKNQDNVALFELGQLPGENGSAVIAGHYGWRSKKSSAFDNLYKLRQGDKLYIEDNQGSIISFVVRENRRYEPEADASEVFVSNDGKSHLNLVTCEGTWDEESQSYSRRLVVFADKE